MQYRQYGKNAPKVSLLGFGVMRLPPRKRGDWGSVNFSRSVKVMRRAMELGVNFFDSHHNYHGGLSEEAIGRALKGWKGQRIYIQTKTPFYRREPQKFFKRLIEEALEKTGVNCIDYLLFHSMNMDMFKKRAKDFFKVTDWAIKKGYVWQRGFSSHDTPENVKKFINTGEFSAMVLSYNWLNRDMADTIAYGDQKGLGVSVMNPLGGGSLAANTPEIMRLIPGAKSAAQIGLRFVMSTPGVCVALSGMNAIEQVDENVKVASRKTQMTQRQRETMLVRLEKIRQRGLLICTACGYCMPCPHGVDIPGNLKLLNQTTLLGLRDNSARVFTSLRKRRNGDASALVCKRCGECLAKCPNEVPIIQRLAETAELLAGK